MGAAVRGAVPRGTAVSVRVNEFCSAPLRSAAFPSDSSLAVRGSLVTC